MSTDDTKKENDYILQSLADRDINASIKDGNVVVHPSNVSSAKTHLHKIGYGDKKVVKEEQDKISFKDFLKENEDLEEMVGYTHASLSKHVKSHGWSLARTDGGHDVYTHPKSKLNLAIPRHKGELSRPTSNKIAKQAKQHMNEGDVIETEPEQPKEYVLEDFDSKLGSHIRNLRNDGHHVTITSRGNNGKSATIVSTKDGKKRKHTLTLNGITHHDERSKDSDSGEEKRGRGRPAGSKSGASH